MAHNDPFTLDLFGNTSLASGLGLGVSAFPTPIEVDDNDPARSSPTPGRRSVVSSPSTPAPTQGMNFHLIGNRGLAKSWRDRARDNLAAIRLAAAIEAEGRQATSDEQAHLIRFTGFGASELANGVFRRPGEDAFRKGWEEIGRRTRRAVVDAGSYASLARCTQYAHYTPEFIVRAIWHCFTTAWLPGGRVLEPGTGTACFRR